MNEKTLRILEFHKITDMLASCASSEPGKALCRALVPMCVPEDIALAQTQTADALARLFKKDRISFSGCRPILATVRALEIGSVLSAPELLAIAALLECTGQAKAYGRKEREDDASDSLASFFDALNPLSPLANEIRRCIISEEEIADDASSTLKHIRRHKLVVNEKIHSQLTRMVNGTYRTYLQDAVITMRGSRYCIPVKAEYRSQVPGMIHDQSASGSTVFIEPAAIVNLNNELKELDIKEQEEIDAILAALSAQAGAYSMQLAENYRLLAMLDFIFAKARLAMEQNATKPIFHKEKIISIRQGRHPLLSKKTAVPIDIHLGRDFDLLIVTGPNTGGKTVSLKTVGLLTLMGQAGLHIPALNRSTLGIFTEIYADIGDEQSIEQSLSTFSAHMTNIVSILKCANEDSLCLFDELGAGTDPTEGAALAIAILEHLHHKGIRTMATTHYSELKVYALSTDFVENACCEFDVETLSPTYRLLIGIPGKSNAFAISSRLGLPDFLIAAAKGHISKERENFEDLLADLEQSRVTIENERLETARYKEEIKTLQERLKAKNEKIDQAKERILREAAEKAREILQNAKETADETIRAMQNPASSIKELEQSRQKLRHKISEQNEKLALPQNPQKGKTVKPAKLHLGDTVKILSMGLKGSVSSLPDQKGNLFVQCGIMRSQANISDIVLIEEKDGYGEPSTKYKKPSPAKGSLSKTAVISTELNLLGMTVDEALHALDKYLDDAYLSHLPSVRIVHGKGTGALRLAVHNHLKRVKYVASYRLGEFGEGDSGITIATFK